MLLISAVLLPLVLLVLLAVLVCLLLVAALALVVLMERTGTDVPAAAAGLRHRLRFVGQQHGPDGPARTPWSQRTPHAAAPEEAAVQPEPQPTAPEPAPAPRPRRSAARSDTPTVQLPAAPSTPDAPPTRTRPVRKPKPVAQPAETEDRQAAMDRLFAPLTEAPEDRPE